MMRNAMSTLNQKFISEYRTNLCVKIERVWSGDSGHILPVALWRTIRVKRELQNRKEFNKIWKMLLSENSQTIIQNVTLDNNLIE